jgi:inosine/xanthosine triphosphatase
MTVVAVGSTNPAKVDAARSAFARWLQDVEVMAFDVDSGVPGQPVSEEVFDGAANRAREARARALEKGIDPDYCVGMEAGAVRLDGVWCAWGAVCVIDRSGVRGMGTTPAFQLPPAVAARLECGSELGDVMEEVSGDRGIRRGRGAVGLFTQGLLTRRDLFESGVLAALAPHVSPEWYAK